MSKTTATKRMAVTRNLLTEELDEAKRWATEGKAGAKAMVTALEKELDALFMKEAEAALFG